MGCEFESTSDFFVGDALRVVVSSPEAGTRIDDDECRCALGMSGGEQQPTWNTHADHGDAFTADCVDHGDDVIENRFDEAGLLVGNRIRSASATRVEPDVSTERRQPVQKMGESRLIPHQVDGKHR